MTPDYTELKLTLRTLFVLRCVAIAGQLLSMALAQAWLDFPVIWAGVWPLIIAALMFNAWTAWQLQTRATATPRDVFIQLGFDIVQLSGVLFFTQGAHNPFITLLVLPIALALFSGQRRTTLAVAILAVLAYLCLLRWSYPAHWHLGHDEQMQLHTFGMWINFIVMASALLACGLSLLGELKRRETALQAMRERSLRDEQILALGTQAAQVAHAFGTPLSTLRVLSHEMLGEARDDEQRQQLQLMQKQVDHCTTLLRQWRNEIDHPVSETLSLQDWLAALVSQLQLVRPEADVRIAVSDGAQLIQRDRLLDQALLSLLNNALDASRSQGRYDVGLRSEWREQDCLIRIDDSGPGVELELHQRLGVPVRSRKPHGLGLGLYLANASIERLGGDVRIDNRAEGGACTRVRLPRQALQARATD